MSESPSQQPSAVQPQQKSWWGRNWIWVVPVGCLTPLLLCGGCLGLFVFGIFGALKSSEVYQQAVAKAQASEEVQSAIGEPIVAGTFVSGSIEVSGASGNADLAIPISGPKGSATVYAVAKKSAGRWSYTTLEVEVKGAAGRIDLLADESR